MPNALSVQSGIVRAVKGENTLSLDYQLIQGRIAGYTSLYKEFGYTDGNLASINVWNNDAKSIYLLQILFSYTSGNLTSKVITDQVTLRVLTTTYGYTGTNLTSTTEVFS